MKTLQWVGRIASILISASAIAGCSGDDPAPGPMNMGGTGNTAGAGGTGTMGTQLKPPESYVILTAADAPANPAAAPTGWTGATSGCVSCHGANGEGVAMFGPEVRHTPATYATWVVRNGRTGTLMAPFAATNISDADLTAVITWLNGAPKPTTGQGLYKDFCGTCHGPNVASGGNVPINIIGKTRAEVSQKVRMGDGSDPGMRNLYMPAYSVADLSETELGLIMDFIMAK